MKDIISLKDKKIYRISRIILAILALIVFNIIFINEDSSWKIFAIIFAIITYLISFPSTLISRKIINILDKIKNKLVKVLIYIILPIIIFFVSSTIGLSIMFIFLMIPSNGEFSDALTQAFLGLFFMVVVFIGLITSYIQTLIILILKHFIKDKQDNMTN